ncbi:hypothetical protein GLOIN_2v1782374 [Rhizophagus irregularis DAOM 181602=DAOM 197198]|nr:hypothetical protein GLOIN_2v1782374 [Rhizophagus irregularis DAOM 181602=DAOM 197198]
METYEITFEEKTPLYYSSQEIFSEETEEDLELLLTNFLKEFDTYEDQEVPPPPVKDANEPVYGLNPAMYTNFSPCILVDYLDNKLQTCGQTKNVRNLCQLVGVWQIDENAVSEYQSKGIPLGVRGIGCKDHLWKMWGKCIQIPCVSLYTCNAVHECQDWTDDKWKEIGEKLGNEVWNSRKIVTDKKSEIQLPISLKAVPTNSLV